MPNSLKKIMNKQNENINNKEIEYLNQRTEIFELKNSRTKTKNSLKEFIQHQV